MHKYTLSLFQILTEMALGRLKDRFIYKMTTIIERLFLAFRGFNYHVISKD